MNLNKLCGLLGMCRRCGRLVTGFDAAAVLCQTPGTLLMVAMDASEKTVKELRFRAGALTIHRLPLTKEQIAHAVGSQKPVAVLAVSDEGFAKALFPLCLPADADGGISETAFPNHDLEEESQL